MTRAAWEVARWEFLRFAKPRDLLIGVVTFAALFGLGSMFGGFLGGKSSAPRAVAVVGAAFLQLEDGQSFGEVDVIVEEREQSEWEQAVLDEDLDGLLIVHDPDQVELRVRRDRQWHDRFLATLSAHRQTQRVQESGLQPGELAAMLAPIESETVLLEDQTGQGKTSNLVALLVVGSMLFGLFLGFSYVFTAITGEKTQRVTESVLSAIRAQEWVDGKILGLTAVVLVNLLTYAVGYLLYKGVAVALMGQSFDLPSGLGDTAALPWLLALGAAGYAYWFSFFALGAATISDPQTSSRSGWLFLAFLPLFLALGGLDDPDSMWMRVLSWTPGFSPAFMPVRILRGDPAVWEILLSLGLLLLSVHLFRLAAGRVFGVSMLMVGKEPSLKELWRWVREPV